MAKRKYPTTTNELAASDLHIDIWPRAHVYWQGTAAQLRAEGLIPDDFEWPRRSRAKHWESGPFEFRIERRRPPFLKGPKGAWADGDWWLVRRALAADSGRGLFAEVTLFEKETDLARERWRHGPEGSEWVRRYVAASFDPSFQAFKDRWIFGTA